MAERPKSGSGLSAKEQFELRKKEKAVEDAKNAEAQKAKDDAQAKKKEATQGRRVMMGSQSDPTLKQHDVRVSALGDAFKADLQQRLTAVHAVKDWSPAKKQLLMAVRRFVFIIWCEETRKRLMAMPVYAKMLADAEKRQAETDKRRCMTMDRFALNSSVSDSVSEVSNLLKGLKKGASAKVKLELVMINAKQRGLTLHQIFGFFLGMSFEEAMAMKGEDKDIDEARERRSLRRARRVERGGL